MQHFHCAPSWLATPWRWLISVCGLLSEVKLISVTFVTADTWLCNNISLVLLVNRNVFLMAITKSGRLCFLWSIGSREWQAVQAKAGSYPHVCRWFSFLSSQVPFSEVGAKWASKLADSQAAVSLCLFPPPSNGTELRHQPHIIDLYSCECLYR